MSDRRKIMTNRIANEPSFTKKKILAVAALIVVAGLIVLGMISTPPVVAQSSTVVPVVATSQSKFEVASIKPAKRCNNTEAQARRDGGQTPGRLYLCGQLAFFIQGAYDVYTKGRGFNPSVMTAAWTANIEGAPSWLNSELYEIDARAAANTPHIVMSGPMLQSLFEERLKLKTHLETRIVPVYELTVAKREPKMQRSDTDCVAFDPMKPVAAPPALDQAAPRPCGGFRVGKGTLDFSEMTISEFSQYLGRNILRRPIIDKVGIAGRFNFHLEFAPDENTPFLRRSENDTGPSIFTAIQEQLGLKLEPAQGPHEFLVIDSVERPAEN
jgi:uncharacterized protein (TIGR03435 family)